VLAIIIVAGKRSKQKGVETPCKDEPRYTKKQKLTIRFLIILYIITFTNCELVSTDRTFFYIATKMMNTSREYSTNFTRVISIFMMCCTSM
jgi:hypothetical protein